jgi:hemerythrin-like domain-containing protein
MQAIDDLINEHGAVVTALDLLEKITLSVTLNNKQASADLTELLEFFSGFVDKCHHAKEEEVLFPALERVLEGREGEVTIRSMLSEHAEGRQHVHALKEQLELLVKGDASAVKQIATHAGAYRQLLSAHIEKENRVLFALAERLIPAQTAKVLLEQFDGIERDRIGKGKHDEFHTMLHRLKASYTC